jgi:hypothetical protein
LNARQREHFDRPELRDEFVDPVAGEDNPYRAFLANPASQIKSIAQRGWAVVGRKRVPVASLKRVESIAEMRQHLGGFKNSQSLAKRDLFTALSSAEAKRLHRQK